MNKQKRKQQNPILRNTFQVALLILFVLGILLYGSGCNSTGNQPNPKSLQYLEITPVNPVVPKGLTRQFTLIAHYSDNTTEDVTTQSTWESSDTAKVTIDENGLATVSPSGSGSVTITGVYKNFDIDTVLSISEATLQTIQVTPADPRVPEGTHEQYIATGYYSDSTVHDITSSVTWESSNTNLATVSNTAGSKGLATAGTSGTGQVTITATFNAISGTALMEVTDAELASIEVTPFYEDTPRGLSQQFTAIAHFTDNSTRDVTDFAQWSSSDTSIATVDDTGYATAGITGNGEVQIIATYGGMTGSGIMNVTAAVISSIQVTPTTKTIAKGTDVQYTATGVFSDGSTEDITSVVQWVSSDTSIAFISNAPGSYGHAYASTDNEGQVTITANLGSLMQGSADLTVSGSVLTFVEVNPVLTSTPQGTHTFFQAIAHYSDNTTLDVTYFAHWQSSDPTIATVDNSFNIRHRSVPGKATASRTKTGVVGITATYNGQSGLGHLEVTQATLINISVISPYPSLPAGFQEQLTATGTYSNGSVKNITTSVQWTSSVPSRAVISNAPGSQGLATAVSPGASTITATEPVSGVFGELPMIVTPAVLERLEITPETANLPMGTNVELHATGYFSDDTEKDLTTSVFWWSSNTRVVFILDLFFLPHYEYVYAIAGKHTGTADITSYYKGITAHATINVTPAVLQSIQINPAQHTMPVGNIQQYQALGTFSDGSTFDITRTVQWSVSDYTRAFISNIPGYHGLATGYGIGTISVIARYPGTAISKTAPLTITSQESTSDPSETPKK